jgi:hypothetical protein
MYLKTLIHSFGHNPYNTELFQYISAFTFGLAFGAVSFGLVWLLSFILIYELFYVYATCGDFPFWRPYFRITVNLVTVMGWSLGRWLYLRLNVFDEKFI